MQFKKFIISAADGGIEEEEVNRFLRGHRVIKVEDRYVSEGAYWVILISYMENESSEKTAYSGNSHGEKRKPEEELNEEQMQRYKAFTDLRLKIAKRENLKAFLVFTNNELIDMAKIDELTVSCISKINGVSDKRAAKYGAEFVDLLVPITSTTELLETDEESRKSDAGSVPF